MVADTNYTATYDRKPIYRGDTLDALRITITDTETGDKVIPVSLCVQIRSRYDKILANIGWSIDEDTGSITIDAVPPEVTREFYPGVHRYDVEYTLPDGRVRTYLSGTVTVLKDVSVCHVV